MTYGLKVKDAEGNIILTEDSRTLKPAKAWHLKQELADASSGYLSFSEIPIPIDSTFYAVGQMLYWAGSTSILTPYIKKDFVGGPQEVVKLYDSPVESFRYKLVLTVEESNKRVRWVLYRKSQGNANWSQGVSNGAINSAYVHLFYG